MKATIEEIRESFKLGYESFEQSRNEAEIVWDLYHNRQFTSAQLNKLAGRGQPAETFNVVKMFARMLVGYYSTVVNTVVVEPTNPRDVEVATVLNDVMTYIFKDSRFDTEGDEIKLGGLVSGLLCSFVNVVDTGERDQFNRPINKVELSYVPDYEIVLDPASVLNDYSDAEYLHRFKWMSSTKVEKAFGKAVREKLTPNHNFTGERDADFKPNYGSSFTGHFRVFDSYLIVHTVLEDDNGKRWSIFWHEDIILLKEEITYKEARWPYRVQKLHSSNEKEFYGLFREVIEPQKSINQAVIKIQLMVNSDKVFVREGAVKNFNDFQEAYNRVNGVIPVLDLSGIKVEKLSVEVQEQYVIIDKALDRIQKVLGINDSFLGLAYASDSGRKVKLQQGATIMSLRYVTARIESFYRSLGEDIAALVKQYYTANQVLLITDEVSGRRWVELNRPMLEFTGNFTPSGEPEYTPILLPHIDPASGDFVEDNEGNIILAPIAEEATEFSYTKFQISIESAAFNDEDEKAQLLLETMMSGQIGQMVAQVNPAGFFKMASLSIKSTKTKFSNDIAAVLEQTSQALQQSPQANSQAAANASGQTPQQAGSSTLKLPTNTNEGVQ